MRRLFRSTLLRRRRTEEGQATIEMLGILPMALLVAGAILQLFLLGYAAVSAESAARLAAREVSKGTSANSAERMAERSVPGIFDPDVDAGSGDRSRAGEEPEVRGGAGFGAVSAEAKVKIPFMGFGVKGLDITVTRYSVMPDTD